MTKIGHTDGIVFSMVLQQYLFAPAMGDNLVMSSPHPDAPGGSAMTLSVVPGDGSAEIAPEVVEALRVMSKMASAVGWGQSVIVEKLPVEGDDEAKYTITIKKSTPTQNRTVATRKEDEPK